MTRPTRELLMLRVAQASGMVSVQADCTVAEAVVLMETRAVATYATLDSIADAVLSREYHFGGRPDPDSVSPHA